MPTQPSPQPSVTEPSRPARPTVDGPPSAPVAATARADREGTLFHLLVKRGWEAELAYTAEQRIHAMTSEIAAKGLEPVLAEFRQMRESTTEELRQIRETMATKAELRQMRESTTEELRQIRETMATKTDLAERDARLIKWVVGVVLAQTAVIVGLVVGVMPLLN